jgi:hypothetical protein
VDYNQAGHQQTCSFQPDVPNGLQANLDWAIIVSSNSIALQFGFQLKTTPGCTQPSQMIARAANDLLKRQNYCTGSDMDYTGLALRLTVVVQARPAFNLPLCLTLPATSVEQDKPLPVDWL